MTHPTPAQIAALLRELAGLALDYGESLANDGFDPESDSANWTGQRARAMADQLHPPE